MIKQKDIANTLKISDTLVCRLLSGERKVSWPLAEKLADMFPGKSISDWKRATPEEFKKAVNQLEKETA